MTEPTRPDPLPAPPQAEHEAGPRPTGPDTGAGTATAPGATPTEPVADLDELPVAEHVAVFEAEHTRLQRELGTIDQL